MSESFAFDYSGPLRPLFIVLGLGPRTSRIELDGDHLHVRMGWAFSVDVPRCLIRSATHDTGRVTGIGVHGLRGTWLVNGSADGMVRIEIDPPTRAWSMAFPVKLKVLRLNCDRADRLVALLS